ELAFGTIDSWLVARLTGGAVHVTDRTNASRTMLYNLGTGEWDPDLLELFGVPHEMLPELAASGQVMGEALPEHLGAAIPVAGMAGDQQAALYGQGCVEAGQAKNTYGTGAFLLVHTGDRRPPAAEGLLTTVAAGPRGEAAFALEGSIFIAGAAIQWLRDGLGILEKASDSEAIARSVPDNGGVYFVPAFVGLGTPHWEPAARGTITGLTRGSTRAHLVRAALESMAYGTADLLDAMEERGKLSVPELRMDGGASANDWLMQFQADVLGRAVERPDMVETTALGAAGLAGVTLGVWKGPEDFLSHRRFDRFEPGITDEQRKALRAGWERAVGVALSWADDG
ncbi:MAG: FGGY family carbohydrate kinase, partial [Gemmatimonadales bacterium]